MGNHEQAAEVAGGVNIVSDGSNLPLMSNDNQDDSPITATQ